MQRRARLVHDDEDRRSDRFNHVGERMKRLLCVFVGTILAGIGQAEKFDFVALGDTAYNLPDDVPVYEALTEKINASRPAFSIHVGDTWGVLECTEENHRWEVGHHARSHRHRLVTRKPVKLFCAGPKPTWRLS